MPYCLTCVVIAASGVYGVTSSAQMRRGCPLSNQLIPSLKYFKARYDPPQISDYEYFHDALISASVQTYHLKNCANVQLLYIE